VVVGLDVVMVAFDGADDPVRDRGRVGLASPKEWDDSAAPDTVPLVGVQRQLDLECGSIARRALDRDRSPERVDDLLDDPQAQANAAVVTAGRGPLEAAEDALVIVLRDAQPAISDRDDRPIVFAFDADIDGFAVPVLDRVGHQVGDDLVETALVPAADDGGGRVDVQRRPTPASSVNRAPTPLTTCARSTTRRYLSRPR
jgi:hypothetical protein